MDYFVIGPDGSEFGPADVALLKSWAGENRISHATQLREKDTGRIVRASDVPGILQAAPGSVIEPAVPAQPTQDWSRAPAYSAPTPHAAPDDTESAGALWGVIWRSAAGLVLFFALGGLGLIFAGYAMYYAVQLKSAGSKYGVAALVIAGASLAAVVIGWIVRLNGAAV